MALPSCRHGIRCVKECSVAVTTPTDRPGRELLRFLLKTIDTSRAVLEFHRSRRLEHKVFLTQRPRYRKARR